MTKDDVCLRKSLDSELFFVDNSEGALSIRYDIEEQEKGVDIVYTIQNNESTPQELPKLCIDGLVQNRDESLQGLDLKKQGDMQPLDPTREFWYDHQYPNAYYSPIIATKDSESAIASSLLYPYLEYQHEVRLKLRYHTGGERIGTFSHYYRDMTFDKFSEQGEVHATVNSGESRTYTLTLRFEEPQYWLYTLEPYKNYFEATYGEERNPVPADLRPVRMVAMAGNNCLDPDENPRGYYQGRRIDVTGWGPFLDTLIPETQTLGYERIMIWQASGLYNRIWLNYPPQLMSSWLPALLDSEHELERVGNAGISLGFWWGRATQIPVGLDDENWHPLSLEDAEYDNPDHIAFLTNELQLGVQRGTQEMGLDAFVYMPDYDRYQWIDDMYQIAPDMKFIHEVHGPDFMHSKMANFYWPRSTGEIQGPHVISWYLNGDQERWAYMRTNEGANFDFGQQLIRWGFTPLFSNIDLTGIDYKLAECIDGQDNDNDGYVDWPEDPGCDCAGDVSEN